jgi:hypothetical protein
MIVVGFKIDGLLLFWDPFTWIIEETSAFAVCGANPFFDTKYLFIIQFGCIFAVGTGGRHFFTKHHGIYLAADIMFSLYTVFFEKSTCFL